MNNVVNMINYYLIHKNADESVIEYIKTKLDSASIEDLIVIQIELLYTDPSDKLVSEFVRFINDKINIILSEIDLYELINLITVLKTKIILIEAEIDRLDNFNKGIFSKIKEKDLNKDDVFDEQDSLIASDLIGKSQDNVFIINKNKSIINSIKIWGINLEGAFNKKLNNSNLNELINSYIKSLNIINRDQFINYYIENLSSKIEKYILNKNIIDMITNIMPELDQMYKNSYNKKDEKYKLLDYYVDVVDNKIKNTINNMIYEEKIILKEKINLISNEILNNDNPNDDFKVLVINSYLIYL